MPRQRPLYADGRLSSPVLRPDHPEASTGSGHTDHELLARLRLIRDEGQESMTAIEEYDPNVCLELSMCKDGAAAAAMLDGWLSRRTGALQRVQEGLMQDWERVHAESAKADVLPRK